MKFHENKLLTTVAAIALALAVGACSSSSSDDDEMAGTPPTPTTPTDTTTQAPETPEDALATAQAGYDALTGESTDAERTAAMTALEAALKLEGNEAEYLAYLEKKVADQAQAKKDADAATAAKEASDKAAEVRLALQTLAGTLPDITVSASSSGALKATTAGYTMSGTAPEAISGFRGAILTKDGAEARVYTNIEDAVATLMDGIYSATSDPGKPKTYTVDTVVDEMNPNNVLWMAVTRADTAETETGPMDARVTSFAGSVSGLAGMFSCSGADGASCTAPVRTTDGSVTVGDSPGIWTFAPTDPNGKIDVPDDDGYVRFGWWLNMMGDDVADGFEVQTFASADGYDDFVAVQGASDTVTGSATYTGGAAGKWAIASTTEDTTEGGHFTATATLGVDFDAHFGAPPDAVGGVNKDGVSVSGTITDFMTGATSRPSWKVTLTVDSDDSLPGVQSAMTLPATADGVTGDSNWTTGGAVDGTGTWEASFHGSEKDTGHPMAVDGTFNAAIPVTGEIARIQGAFGATK